jgi:ABC-type multidrug transport system ATPase subunit
VDQNGQVHPIIQGINMHIERGMRIAVRGPNGAGKSTLMSAFSGELALSKGSRDEGEGLTMGIFKQDLAQELNPDILAVTQVTNLVREKDPSCSDLTARTTLGTLGLTGEKATRLIRNLSGGEKARVALASFVLIPSNFCLLDEPSNHLDREALDALTEALMEYKGSFVIISHDRDFLDKIHFTHVLTVVGGRAVLEERQLNELDWVHEESSCSSSLSRSKNIGHDSTSGNNQKEKKGGNGLSRAERKDLNKFESQIKKLEKKIALLDVELIERAAEGFSILADITAQADAARFKLSEVEHKWMELAEKQE